MLNLKVMVINGFDACNNNLAVFNDHFNAKPPSYKVVLNVT